MRHLPVDDLNRVIPGAAVHFRNSPRAIACDPSISGHCRYVRVVNGHGNLSSCLIGSVERLVGLRSFGGSLELGMGTGSSRTIRDQRKIMSCRLRYECPWGGRPELRGGTSTRSAQRPESEGGSDECPYDVTITDRRSTTYRSGCPRPGRS